MILPDYIKNYKERKWKCYENMSQADMRAIPAEQVTNKDMELCNSEGGFAISMAKSAERTGVAPNWLLLDMELLAAGLNPLIGCHVCRLTEPWQGHCAGALVIVAYTGLEETLMTYTLCVETD